MGEHHGPVGDGHIGEYLRSVRESRRLSLDSVVEMTGALPGSVSKSYLSRMENGLLEPTFPRLYALSQVYGVPIASLAERFEVDLRRRGMPAEFGSQPAAELRDEARRLHDEGHYADALVRVEALLDQLQSGALSEADVGVTSRQLRNWQISCLVKLDRFHAAKEHCEDLLADPEASASDRAFALYYFARCCHSLGKFPLAMMAVAVLEQELATGTTGLCSGNIISLKGNVLSSMGRYPEAAQAFRQAADYFDTSSDPVSACRHRINYGLMLDDCEKPRQAQRQLIATLRDARRVGSIRLVAVALYGLGKATYRLGERRAAESHLLESNQISRQSEYVSLVFRNCYWLWRIAQDDGNATLTAAHCRTLRAYLARVPETLPEVQAFRATEIGGVK